MQEHETTNSYLKNEISKINDFLENSDDNIPHELLANFINELGVSTLIIPGIIEDNEITIEILSEDESLDSVIPVFTDADEFVDYHGKDCEYDMTANEIDFYIDLLNENEFDGLIINPGAEEFFIGRDLIIEIPFTGKSETEDSTDAYDANQLFDFSKSINNDSLEEFIKNGDHHFEALMLELHESNLLNIIASEDDLSESAEDKIINLEDKDYSICITNDDNKEFGILFTGKDIIQDLIEKKEDLNYYCQLTQLDDFMEFVLKNDMDGIIINPGTDDYIISREYLIEAYGGLTYNNPVFKESSNYAFPL